MNETPQGEADSIPRMTGRLSTQFFRREQRADELHDIETAASKGVNTFLILGERGAGKSSLAAYLAEYPPDGCTGGVYLDLDRCYSDYREFIFELADEIATRGIPIDPDIAEEAEVIDFFSQRGRFLLAIDEIEALVGREVSREDRENFYRFLRTLRESCPELIFLFCGWSETAESGKETFSELISATSSVGHEMIIYLKSIPQAERPAQLQVRE